MKITGLVRGVGHLYPDGSESLEIRVKKDESQGLPYQEGQRVQVTLVVDGQSYQAGLRSTLNNPDVWISPDLIDEDRQPTKLAHVLHHASMEKNQKVELESSNGQIMVTPL